jgi:hypothetical protein
MPFGVVMSQTAKRELERLPPALQDHIVNAIEQLAANPMQLSRPSVFPWPATQQLFRPDPVDEEGIRHEFVILFRYGQDEQTICVNNIGHFKVR